MASNQVELKVIVDDDGTLRAVGNEAKAAAGKTDDLGKSSDKLNKSQTNTRRNLHGTAQMSSNLTKNFAKQQQGITGGLVPAYAVLASNVFAISAAFNFFKRQFDVQALQSSQIAFAENTGTALGSLTQRLRAASDGMLGFQEAGQAAAIGLAKGFSPKQLEDLAQGARKASTALGRDFQDAFDRLVRGASKAEPELLDELGITLRLETATNRYARAIGKNRQELTEYERSQAVLIETQRQLNENFGDVDAISNPFIKLQKTFEDLVKDLTGAVMPIMTAFVDIINRSTGAAVAVFGLIGVSILKTMLPMDELSAKFNNFFKGSVDGVKNTFDEMVTFGKGIKSVSKEIQASRAGAVKGAARAALAGGADSASAILQKMKKGMVLTPQEKGRIKRSIREAEAQYKQFGAVTTGMFKGVNIAIVRDVGGALKQAEMGTVSLQRRIGQMFKFIQLGAKMSGKAIILGLKMPLLVVGGIAKGTGKLISKAMSFAGFIGIFMLIKEAVQEILKSPFKIITSVASGIDTVLGFLEGPINSITRAVLGVADIAIDSFNGMTFSIKTAFFNMASAVLGTIDDIINNIVSGVNGIRTKINEFLPEEMRSDMIEFKSMLKDGLGAAPAEAAVSKLADTFQGFNLVGVGAQLADFLFDMEKMKEIDEASAAVERANRAVEAFNDTVEGMRDSTTAIKDGLKNTQDEAERGFKIAEAIRTLNISTAFKAITRTRDVLDKDGDVIGQAAMFNTAQRTQMLEKLKTELGGIANLTPKLKAAFDEALADPSNTQALEDLEVAAGASAGAIKLFDSSLQNFKDTLGKSMGQGALSETLRNLTSLEAQANGIANGFEALEQKKSAVKVLEQFNDALGDAGMSAREFKIELIDLITQQANLTAVQAALNIATGRAGELMKANVEIQQAKIQLDIIDLQLKTDLDAKDREALETKRQLLEIEERLANAKKVQQAFSVLSDTSGSASTGFAGSIVANREARGAALKAIQDNEVAEFEKSELSKTLISLNMEEERQRVIKQIRENAAAEFAEQSKSSQMMEGFQGFSKLAEDFKALGPEGQLMGAFSQSLSNVGQSMVAFNEILGSKTATAADKAKAGLAVVGSAINGIAAMQKAASAGRIRALDQEINAEKKRDGKSAESQAKIKELEKKKVAEQRKAFEQEKKMKMAQTIINTATGAMNAMGTFPPPFNFIMAAATVAMGMKQLQMISATSFQGGGSMGGGGPTSITAGKRKSSVDIAKSQGGRGELAYMRGESGQGGPENFTPAFGGYRNRAEGGNTAFMVGEQGPELFVPQRPGRIVPNDDITAGGPTNVSFNINAVDAAGVEDLLVRQRGNIIGMIRDAANSYGEDFVEKVDTSILTPTAEAGVSRY